MIAGSMSSAPVPGTNGAAAPGDDVTGLSEPLLAVGGSDGGFHAGALTKVVVATALDGKAKANKGSVKAEAKDGYWVEVPRQLDATAAADLESGGEGGRPLMFQEKKVKASLLYPYR